MKSPSLPDNYVSVLAVLKEHIALAQVKTVTAANKQMLLLYWQVGNAIRLQKEQEQWGAKVIERLSKDIGSAFPKLKGFSPRNLLYMEQFASLYTPEYIRAITGTHAEFLLRPQSINDLVTGNNALRNATPDSQTAITQQPVAQFTEEEFLQSPVANISWSHHVVLMNKVRDDIQRMWYIFNTIEYGNSRNVLAMQIDSGLFERQIQTKKVSNFSRTLPAPQSDLAQYLMKDPYIFDFVQAKDQADERSIEEQLERNITQFLLELGKGFAFVGRQVMLRVGESEYFVDLLFYHLHLRSYVVIELKARAFQPADTGQLNFYINVVNDRFRSPPDNPTIGLLLCKGKDDVLAEYALTGYNQPMGISDYELSKAVPEHLSSELPSIEEIEQQLIQ